MTRHDALPTHDHPTSRPTVSVKLQGKHGRDRSMVIDEVDWSRVRLVLGERWNIGRAGPSEYVVAYGGKAAKLTPGNQPLILARWLMWAERTDVVLYRDRDPLNLSRANLEVIGKRDLPERMRSRRGAFFEDVLGRCAAPGTSVGTLPSPCSSMN